MKRRSHSAIAAWLGFLPGWLLMAAEPALPPAVLPVLTQTEQILRLSPEEARRGHPVRLRGVVTYHDADWNLLFLQDASGGIYIYTASHPSETLAGKQVEVEGLCQPGRYTPMVTLSSLKVVGAGEWPAARRTTVPHLLTGAEDCQWVEVLGTVKMLGESGGRLEFTVEEAGQGIKAVVFGPKPSPNSRLLNARIRIRGVCGVKVNDQRELLMVYLYAPGPEQIVIEEPGPEDPFAVPIRPIAELARLDATLATNLVRIQGIVSNWVPGRTFKVQDRSGSIVVESSQTNRITNQTFVDVVGFVRGTQPSLRLSQGRYRRLGLVDAASPSESETDDEPRSLKGERLRLLRQAKQVLNLPEVEAERGYPVRLRAVVTYYDGPRNTCYVQDETGGIYLAPHDQELDVQTGDWVDVEGYSATGDFAPILIKPRFQILGRAPLPPAPLVTINRLVTGEEDGQWAELTGVVHVVAKEEGQLYLDLGVEHGGELKVRFPGFWDASLPSHLVAARVSVRGVCGSLFNPKRQLIGVQMFVPDLHSVMVTRPGVADPFSLPIRPLASLMQFRSGLEGSERIRVQGIVALQRGTESLFVQDGANGLYVQTQGTNLVKVGDRIDVVGFPTLGQYTPALQHAIFRRIGAGKPPTPVPATIDQAQSGTLDAVLISLDARLVDRVPRSWDQVLILQSGQRVFDAYLEKGKGHSKLGDLRHGSEVKVTGVCSIQPDAWGKPRAFRILLRSTDDVQVLHGPPWWTSHRLWTALGIMLGIIILGAAWVLALQQRVQAQTRLIGQQLQFASTYAALGQKLNSAATPIDAARTIAKTAQDLLGWDACMLSLYLPAANQTEVLLAIDTADGARVEFLPSYTREAATPTTRRVIQDGPQLILRQNPSDSPGDLQPAGNVDRRSASLMFVPIHNGTKTIGVLSIQSYQNNAYDRNDLAALQALADHCGGALERIQAQESLKKAYDDLEQKVKERTQEYQTIFDSVPAYVVYKDANNVEVRINQFAANLMGRRKEEIEGKPVSLHHPALADRYYQDDLEVIRTGQPKFGIIEPVISAIGETRWLQTDKLPYRDPAGKIVGVVAFGVDITERKRAEAALQAAHADLEQRVEKRTQEFSRAIVLLKQEVAERQQAQVRLSTLNQTGQALNRLAEPAEILELICDMIGKVMNHANLSIALYDQAEQRLSFPVYRIQGQPHPAGARPFGNGLAEHVIRTRLPLLVPCQVQAELARHGITGIERLGKSLLAVPILAGDKVMGVITSQDFDQENAYDTTHAELLATIASQAATALENARLYSAIQKELAERKQTEKALRNSEERFARAFRANPVAVTISTLAEGRLIEVNDSFLLLFGFRREEVIGRTALELGLWVNPEDRAQLVRTLARHQSVRELEFKFRGKAGEIHNTLVSVEPIEVDQEAGLLFITHDVTERMNLEAQLRQSQKMEAVGQLAAGVAHDFNNLLTIIQGHTSVLLATAGFDETTREPLREVYEASERAANLTRQLLTFSRKQVMQPRIVDLNEVVGNTAKMLHRLLGENISLQFNYAPSLPPIHADPGMLEQIIINLAVNARDAMPRGGRLAIQTGAPESNTESVHRQTGVGKGTFVCLTVTDTGCGMDEATLNRIFEPFFTTKEVGKGTGLGLATVYGIVKQHRGWIDVESQVGTGTTFRIFLPSHTQASRLPIETASAAKVRGGHETILIVEDEPALRMLVRSVLQRFGYKVLEAATGREALQMWPQCAKEVALVLTDMMMPEGISGWELAEQLKAQTPDLKVIYTSGYSVDLLGENRELKEGVNFLAKPYPPQALAKAVRNYLDRT